MDIYLDTFNSKIFNIKMGNIVGISPDANELKSLISLSKKQGYDHLSVKIPTQNKEITNIFLKEDFDLVDTQLLYCIPTNNFLVNNSNDKFLFREIDESDFEHVIKIAEMSYVLDQFHSDSNLDNSLCDKYYSEWMKNCCNGLADQVMIIELNNVAVGYITLNYLSDGVYVGLAAVDEKYRGIGCFSNLINYTLKHLYNKRYDKLYYGTQLSNVPVLKTMGKFNGYIVSSNYILHKMLVTDN